MGKTGVTLLPEQRVLGRGLEDLRVSKLPPVAPPLMKDELLDQRSAGVAAN